MVSWYHGIKKRLKEHPDKSLPLEIQFIVVCQKEKFNQINWPHQKNHAYHASDYFLWIPRIFLRDDKHTNIWVLYFLVKILKIFN